jgi:hypothetical protein
MLRAARHLWCLFFLCAAVSTASAQGAGESVANSREIYGRELMTPQERDAYRERVWNLRTEVERERFRQDHQTRMQNRAVRRGMTLPEEASAADRRRVEGGEGGSLRDDGLRRWSPDNSQGGLRQWPPSSATESRTGDGLRRLNGRR